MWLRYKTEVVQRTHLTSLVGTLCPGMENIPETGHGKLECKEELQKRFYAIRICALNKGLKVWNNNLGKKKSRGS